MAKLKEDPPDNPAEELRAVTFKIPVSWKPIIDRKSENFSFWIRKLIYATFTPAEKNQVPPPDVKMGPK